MLIFSELTKQGKMYVFHKIYLLYSTIVVTVHVHNKKIIRNKDIVHAKS